MYEIAIREMVEVIQFLTMNFSEMILTSHVSYFTNNKKIDLFKFFTLIFEEFCHL